eukprot:CAMPEP_0174310548 /NCGR_PEP_ID=MMETSP0810-20121108/3113_1 /TAXON_ID=73025 ORGANISM="Eutreptiella gymnastica-like, Strain CCMP1594" /NCGR_SAMPLE_ID=MMETSP0810 /ASSEMBLY_ACC=CAM_ASM_000659 /LENGTH=128 /DNA_ID=CAMNT_0015418477 /DNA_START=444 /DNA_END=825 /DNA_ORIENTATION=+
MIPPVEHSRGSSELVAIAVLAAEGCWNKKITPQGAHPWGSISAPGARWARAGGVGRAERNGSNEPNNPEHDLWTAGPVRAVCPRGGTPACVPASGCGAHMTLRCEANIHIHAICRADMRSCPPGLRSA